MTYSILRYSHCSWWCQRSLLVFECTTPGYSPPHHEHAVLVLTPNLIKFQRNALLGSSSVTECRPVHAQERIPSKNTAESTSAWLPSKVMLIWKYNQCSCSLTLLYGHGTKLEYAKYLLCKNLGHVMIARISPKLLKSPCMRCGLPLWLQWQWRWQWVRIYTTSVKVILDYH